MVLTGLQIIGIIFVSIVVYLLTLLVPAFAGVDGTTDGELGFMIAWLTGMCFFVAIVLIWATGTPFPLK